MIKSQAENHIGKQIVAALAVSLGVCWLAVIKPILYIEEHRPTRKN